MVFVRYPLTFPVSENHKVIDSLSLCAREKMHLPGHIENLFNRDTLSDENLKGVLLHPSLLYPKMKRIFGCR